MCPVPKESLAFCVGSTDPLPFRRQLIPGLLTTAVVAAQFVLAAWAASANIEQHCKQPTEYGNRERSSDHENVVLNHAAVGRRRSRHAPQPINLVFEQRPVKYQTLILGDADNRLVAH
jgi:hypothetical protein